MKVGFRERSGADVAAQVLGQERRPDALVCANDELALSTMKALQRPTVRNGVTLRATDPPARAALVEENDFPSCVAPVGMWDGERPISQAQPVQDRGCVVSEVSCTSD